nr:type IX secretion system sortase PorU [Bacteroides sp.]
MSKIKHKTAGQLVLTAAAVMLTVPTVHALDTSYYSTTSRLASGTRWVKVKVTTEGVQRISHDQLRAWGFSEPEKVHVYGFSGMELASNTFSMTAPDDLPVQYSQHSDDALFFYGESDVRLRMRSATDIIRTRNHYATYSCYFLSDAEPDAPLASALPFTEKEAAEISHTSIDYIEPEEYIPGEGGVMWFSTPLKANESRTFTLHAEDFLPTATENTPNAVFSFLPVVNATQNVTVQATLDPNTLNRTSNSYTRVSPNQGDRTYLLYNSLTNPSIIRARLWNGHTDFPITFTNTYTGADWIAVDYVTLLYSRYNRLADHGQIQMHYLNLDGGSNVSVTEAGENCQVWNVSTPLSVRPLEGNYDPEAGTMTVSPGEGALTLVAFDPESTSLPTPAYVETLGTATNLHADAADYDMVIITTTAMLPAAQRLATLHEERQGLMVKVVDQQDIFNEFSSGTPSAIAYRRYVKMLHDRNPGMLKHLLLLGRGTYDHRHLNITDDGSYLFCYEVEEDREWGYTSWSNYEVTNFCSDNYFGMLADSFTPRSIYRQTTYLNVGRMPAKGLSDAHMLIDKVENYMDTYLTRDFMTRTAFLGGAGDDNSHMQMADNASKLMLQGQPDVTAYKVYRGFFRNSSNSDANLRLCRRFLIETASAGVNLLGFSGHSALTGVDCGFSVGMLSDIAFPNHPLVFLSTCAEMQIDSSKGYLGDALVASKDAAVGVIGACRTVYLNRNKALYDAFMERYYAPAAGDCVGDVWRKAHNEVLTNFDQTYGLNTLCYNLVCDPALPLAVPDRRATVNTVNGTAASGSMQVTALKPVTLTGSITKNDGTIDRNFNGEVVITIHDGAHTVTTIATDSDPSTKFDVDHSVLARTGATVKNGDWTATLTPPVGSVAGKSNRIQVWATNGDGNMALGSYTGLSVTDPASAAATDDTEGPEISEMYLNTSTFAEGDAVASDFTLHARIEPDASGINVSNATVGHRLTVSLDGSSSSSIASNLLTWGGDGAALLKVPYSGVVDGNHTLTLTVSDNVGNQSMRTIPFTVVSQSLAGTLSIDNPIVTGKTSIGINVPSSAQVTRVVVEDGSHNTVVSRTAVSFPWNWTPDASLPDGNYRIRAFFTDGSRWGATEPLDVIIIRQK